MKVVLSISEGKEKKYSYRQRWKIEAETNLCKQTLLIILHPSLVTFPLLTVLAQTALSCYIFTIYYSLSKLVLKLPTLNDSLCLYLSYKVFHVYVKKKKITK